MSTTDTKAPGLGLEHIQRGAFLTLYRNLNDEIALLESAWASFDQALSDELGETYTEITLEPIEPANFHLGHRPSLIEAPINKYPNVSVMAYQAVPDLPDDFDHAAAYQDRLFVEVMVKSPEYAPEDLGKQQMAESVVNSRIQRTTDACNNVLMRNPTLLGTVDQIPRSPSVTISDVFVRAERTTYGNKWLWQGSRLEYTLNKVAALYNQSDSSARFLPRREGLDVDQIG